MCVARVSSRMLPSSVKGSPQALTRAFMPGVATQWRSPPGRPASITRPIGSSTRTALALQGRHRPGTVPRASSKRGSRTVKYCVPWSKLPKGLRRVAMRPPSPRLFSNRVTWWPAWRRVRAQAMPAMPTPMMAMCCVVMRGTLHAMRGLQQCGACHVLAQLLQPPAQGMAGRALAAVAPGVMGGAGAWAGNFLDHQHTGVDVGSRQRFGQRTADQPAQLRFELAGHVGQ